MCDNETEHLLSVDQLRVLSDPVRLRILEELCRSERSVQGLKESLAPDLPSNLYYHVDRLLEAGLIKLERSKQRRGATEKYYRAVASRFSAGVRLGVGEHLSEAVRASFSGVMSRLAKELQSERQPRPIVTQLTIRTSRAESEKLRTELEQWIARAAAADGKGSKEVITLQVWLDDSDA